MSLAGFSRIGEITLPSITGSHSNFRLLLRWADFHADVLSKLDDGGGDLRFSSDAAGSNQLACDVVEFNKVGSSIQVRVLIPTAATGQVIHVWGDNTGATQPAVGDPFGRNATWANHAIVMHLETPASPVDSSGMTTVSATNSPTSTTGQIGGGASLTNAGYSFTETTNYDFTNGYRVSFWANITDLGSFGNIIFAPNQFEIRRNSTSAAGLLRHNGTNVFISNYVSAFAIGTLSKYDFVWDETNGSLTVYRDGAVTTATATNAGVPNITNVSRIFYNNASENIDAAVLDEYLIENNKASADKVLTEYQNQSAAGAWVTMAPVSAGTSIDVNATLGAINYTSQSATVSLTGSIDVASTLGAISYTSQPATVQLTGDIDVSPTLGTIVYNSHGATVQLSGSIDVTNTLGAINYTSNNAQVQLAGEINVTTTLGQINYTSQNAVVNLDGGLVVNASLGQINYTSQPAIVTLQGVIEANATLGSIVYNSNNAVVQIGEGQTITIVTAGFRTSPITTSFKPNPITSQFKPDSITATFRNN